MDFNPVIEIGWDIFQNHSGTIYQYWENMQKLYENDIPDWLTWENVVLGWNYAQYRIVEARWMLREPIQLGSL